MFNFIIKFAFLQTLFFLLIFLFSKKKRQNVNPSIVVFMVTFAIGLVGHIIYQSAYGGQSPMWLLLAEGSALLFGTTTYLFVHSSLSNKKNKLQSIQYYLPAVVYCIILVGYFIIPSREIQLQRSKQEINTAIFIFHAYGLLVNGLFWYWAYRKIQHFEQTLMNEVSYVVHTKFLRFFVIGIGGLLTIWSIIYVLALFQFPLLERTVRPFIWFAMSFILLIVCYLEVVSPELFRFSSILPQKELQEEVQPQQESVSEPIIIEENEPKEKPKKYKQSKLSNEQLDALKIQLEQIMESQKPYLNKKLLRAELAELLEISNPELARLLNERIGLNFFEFVNYYRIKEFLVLAKQEDAKQLTLFGIAQEAGFNSKATFYKSFKKIMGKTPSAYFKTVEQ